MNLYSIARFGVAILLNRVVRLSSPRRIGVRQDAAVPATPPAESAGSTGQSMSRVYGEPVEVQTREDGHRPARFVWRGRRYAVRSVHEHWVVNRDWWREDAPGQAQPELEFWRVEASADRGRGQSQGRSQGQSRASGIYELRRDVAAGSWTLRRVAD